MARAFEEQRGVGERGGLFPQGVGRDRTSLAEREHPFGDREVSGAGRDGNDARCGGEQACPTEQRQEHRGRDQPALHVPVLVCSESALTAVTWAIGTAVLAVARATSRSVAPRRRSSPT